jgi:hypothetical protein
MKTGRDITNLAESIMGKPWRNNSHSFPFTSIQARLIPAVLSAMI